MPADVAQSLQGERLLRCDGPMPRKPSSGAPRAGARCTVEKGSRDHSPRRACGLRCDGPPRPRHQGGPIFRLIDRWEAVEEKALTPQSINLIEAALRRGGVGPGRGFGAWFAGRVSGRGGAATDGAAGGDAAVPASLRSRRPRAITMRPSARRATRLGLKGNCQLTISCHPIAAGNRRVEG
jgi:hypothetical protein